jgi:TBC1 domain family protein 5
MHELLAVCFLTVDRDSLLPPRQGTTGDPLIRAMYAALDRRYVEHDAFGLFQEVMRGAKAFYEWRAEEGPVRRTELPGTRFQLISISGYGPSLLLRRPS